MRTYAIAALLVVGLGAPAPAPLPADVDEAVESIVGDEIWWNKQIAEAWRNEGIPCKTDVQTPDGVSLDIVTASTVWAVEFDDDMDYAFYEAMYGAATMEGKQAGIVFVSKNDYRKTKYFRTALVCKHYDLRLKVFKAAEVVQ